MLQFIASNLEVILLLITNAVAFFVPSPSQKKRSK